MTQNPKLVEKARDIAYNCCAAKPYHGMEYEVAKEAALTALSSREVPAEIFETAFVLVQLGRSATSEDIRNVGQWILDTAKDMDTTALKAMTALDDEMEKAGD